MIFLDTTVLVYAVGVEHALRAPARSIIDALEAGRARATTTVEVVQEFTHTRARRHSRQQAVVDAERYATLLAPLVVTDPRDLDEGLALFARHARLGSFDAVLAATALRLSPRAFVSADRAFAGVEGLPFVELGSPELAALV